MNDRPYEQFKQQIDENCPWYNSETDYIVCLEDSSHCNLIELLGVCNKHGGRNSTHTIIRQAIKQGYPAEDIAVLHQGRHVSWVLK